MAVLRGNAGEVATLVGVEAEVRGVESVGGGGDPAELAREAATTLGVVASVTGPVDHVSDGERAAAVANGHELLAAITGTGCMSTALTGCFLAGKDDPFEAAVEALVAFGVAGEDAAAEAKGPGSFHVALYDALAALDPSSLTGRAKVDRETCAPVTQALPTHATMRFGGSLCSDTSSPSAGGSRDRVRRSTARAAAGGATVVQLRLKVRRPRRSSSSASLGDLEAELVVNDDLEAALELGCGVHLGQTDPGIERAREAGITLGISVAKRREAAVAEFSGATYLGAGPIWETPSKPDAGAPIGLDGLRDICLSVSVPVVAIGGIDASNAAECIRAGAAGVAVIRAVAEIEALREAVDAAL